MIGSSSEVLLELCFYDGQRLKVTKALYAPRVIYTLLNSKDIYANGYHMETRIDANIIDCIFYYFLMNVEGSMFIYKFMSQFSEL